MRLNSSQILRLNINKLMKIGFKSWWLNSVFRLLNEALGTLCESGTNVAVLRNGFIFVYVL